MPSEACARCEKLWRQAIERAARDQCGCQCCKLKHDCTCPGSITILTLADQCPPCSCAARDAVVEASVRLYRAKTTHANAPTLGTQSEVDAAYAEWGGACRAVAALEGAG